MHTVDYMDSAVQVGRVCAHATLALGTAFDVVGVLGSGANHLSVS